MEDIGAGSSGDVDEEHVLAICVFRVPENVVTFLLKTVCPANIAQLPL